MTQNSTDLNSLPDSPANERDWRQLIVGFVHIVALNALAVAQPLLDVLGKQAEFFVAHQARGADVLLFGAVLLIVIPAIAIGMDAIAWFVGRRVHRVVHGVIIASYIMLFTSHVLARLFDLPPWLHFGASLLVAAGVGVAYVRFSGLRTFMTFLAPAPLAIGLLFIFASSASAIVFPAPVDSVGAAMGSSDTDVVFIVLDELPTQTLLNDVGDIDDAFPAFRRLASMSDWFVNTTTLSDASHIAVPALLAGAVPDPGEDRLPVLSDYPFNVFTALAPSHEVYGSERITELCADDVCGSQRPGLVARTRQMMVDSAVVYAHVIVPEQSRDRLPDISNRWAAFVEAAPAENGTSEQGLERERFTDFIGALGSLDEPALYFIHSILPHRPWVYTADGTLYEEAVVPGHDTTHPATWLSNEYLVAQGYERHREQARYTDQLLGQVLDKLESDDLLTDSVVVVTADHGINFAPDEFDRTATLSTYDQILPVPLFVKAPGQTEGAIITTPVEIVDILATILDLVDLPWQGLTDGHSIYDDDYTSRPKRFFNAVEEVNLGVPTIDIEASHSEIIAMVDRSSGPEADVWLGQSVSGIPLGPSRGVGTIRDIERFATDDVSNEPLPLHITGRIEADPLEADASVLLAVDGTIVSSGRTYAEGPIDGLFSLLVPPASLAAGPEALQLFILGADDGLSEVTLSDAVPTGEPSDYRLATDGGVTYLDNDRGSVIVLDEGWLKAGVEVDQRAEDGTRLISGWAFDRRRPAPVDVILAFGDGGQLVVAAEPSADRPDVEAAFSVSGIQPAGWVLEVLPAQSEGIRLVVLSSGRAAEIQLP